jgi:hypothetical protein
MRPRCRAAACWLFGRIGRTTTSDALDGRRDITPKTRASHRDGAWRTRSRPVRSPLGTGSTVECLNLGAPPPTLATCASSVHGRLQRWRDPDSNRGHHDFQSCAPACQPTGIYIAPCASTAQAIGFSAKRSPHRSAPGCPLWTTCERVARTRPARAPYACSSSFARARNAWAETLAFMGNGSLTWCDGAYAGCGARLPER